MRTAVHDAGGPAYIFDVPLCLDWNFEDFDSLGILIEKEYSTKMDSALRGLWKGTASLTILGFEYLRLIRITKEYSPSKKLRITFVIDNRIAKL